MVQTEHILFVHSVADGHLGFLFGALMNNAAVSVCVQVFFMDLCLCFSCMCT